jgi:L-rhamnose isomerase
MIQTVGMAQVLVARAALVDLQRLTDAQRSCDLIAAGRVCRTRLRAGRRNTRSADAYA